MYLFIFEDGAIKKKRAYDDIDMDECDGGLLQIIDIRNPNDPVEYINGIWVTIDLIK